MVDTVRLVLQLDVVRARSWRGERHHHRATVLRLHAMHIVTIGVKHLALIHTEQRVEVPGRDRLTDREGVVARWHRDRHPV